MAGLEDRHARREDDAALLGEGSMERRRLREAALTGVRWVAAGRLAGELLTLGSAIVLAHLVTPAEFGRAAIALILAVFATALTGHSFGTPLVQRPDIEPGHVRSAVTLSLALGLGLTLFTYLTAPFLTAVFGEETVHLLQLMSPVFVLSAIGTVPHALLQRSLAFRRLSTVEVASIIVRAIASVALAAVGFGASALVLGALAGTAAFSVLLFVGAPRLAPGWDARRAREIVSFGAPTAASGLISQTNRNLDYAILGAQLAPAQVGYYWRAYQLGMEYERKLTTIITRMALPIFSRTRTLDDMRRIRARMMRVNAVAIFGILAAFIAVAPVLVPAVFGDAWEPSVVPAQILAIAGMAAALNAGAGPLVLAAGRPRALMWLSMAFFFVYGATIYFAGRHGLIVVCVAATIAHVARTAALHWFLLDRLVGIPFTDLRHELVPAGSASVALLALSMPTVELLRGAGLPAGIVVTGALLVGAFAYLGVLRVFFPPAWRDIAEVSRRILTVRRRSPAPGLQAAAGATQS
jgi:O-antigen/teichoic acid export membrane protein